MSTSQETAEGQEEDQDSKDILDLVRRCARSFAKGDVDAFLSIWDDELGDRIVYQPEELGHAIHGLDGLREYFERFPQVIAGVRDHRPVEVSVDVVGDMAIVYNRFWCRLSFHAPPWVSDGQIRQSFVMRRRADGWRVVHYHESRQAPGFEQAVGAW